MKIEVSVNKRFVFATLGILLAMFGVLFVSAQFDTPNPGHAGSEVCDNRFCVSWPDGNSEQAFVLGGFKIGPNFNGRSFIDFLNSADEIESNIVYQPGGGGVDRLIINNVVDGNGNPPTAHVIINPLIGSGNVGIGLINPSAKLEVNGDILASGKVCGSSGCFSGVVTFVSKTEEGDIVINCPLNTIRTGCSGGRPRGDTGDFLIIPNNFNGCAGLNWEDQQSLTVYALCLS